MNKNYFRALVLFLSILAFSCSSGDDGVTNNVDENVENGGDGTIGIDPKSVLSLVTNVAAGSDCSNGGLKVELGIDTNGNNVLDPNEITNTDFVCNGADGVKGIAGPTGANGKDGNSTLITTEAEPAGTNCKTGGVKINIGLDINNNSVLDATEITVVDFICNSTGVSGGITNLVLTGDITDEEARIKIENTVGPDTQFILIQNTSSLTTVDLAGVTETIDIEIRNNKELISVSFPNLVTSVDNFFITSNSKLATLQFPVLKDVNYVEISNILASELEMPILENVFNQIRVFNSQSLNSFRLPLVESANLSISNNSSLSELDVPLLKEGSVFIFGSNLSSVDLSTLENGFVNILGNTISSIDLSSLITGEVSINDTNMALLNFPKLREASRIVFSRNPLLTSINIPKLEGVNNIHLSENSSLVDFELPLVSSMGGVVLPSNINQPTDSQNGVSNFIRVENNRNLDSFSIPLVSELNNTHFAIFNNINLINLNFSNALGANNDIEISANPLLESINFSRVTSLISLTISNNPLLSSINFDNLESITGEFFGSGLEGLNLYDNNLTSISFPKLVNILNFNKLNVSQEATPLSVNLPLLEEVGSLEVIGTNVDLSSIRNFSKLNVFRTTAESTNAIFSQLVSIVPAISGKEISISNAPTGQGITDAETLVTNGNIVSGF